MKQQIKTGMIVEFNVAGESSPIRGRVLGYRSINDDTRVIVDTKVGVFPLYPSEVRIVPLIN